MLDEVTSAAPASAWSVLDAVDQAVCVADMRAPDCPLVYVNPAFTATTGYAAADVVGRNCRFLHAGLDEGPGAEAEELRRALAEVRALLRDGRPGVVVLLNRRADGSRFANELSLSPLHDAAGAVSHYVAVQRDVTALAEARRAERALADELDQTARAVQSSLVPSVLPRVPGWSMASGYQPATRAGGRGAVSGDFYDVFAGPDGAAGSWFAVLGDVSGRGPRAAAATGALRWGLRGVGTVESSAAALLTSVAHAVHDSLDDRFATLAAVRLDPAGARGDGGARVHVALAGHPRPVLLPARGPARPVGVPGTLVGPFADVEVHDAVVDVAPGDQLVLYTDGVTEAADGTGRQLDDDGLLAALDAVPVERRTGPGAAAATVEALTAAVARHVAGGPVDDLTLLVVARDGAPPPPA